jgi:hypothetical protein
MTDDMIVFSITSGFGHLAQAPYVQVLIKAADFMTQMPPEKARELALNLLASAEAAEQDAFFISFMREKLGANDQQIAVMLLQFREWRESNQSETEIAP